MAVILVCTMTATNASPAIPVNRDAARQAVARTDNVAAAPMVARNAMTTADRVVAATHAATNTAKTRSSQAIRLESAPETPSRQRD